MIIDTDMIDGPEAFKYCSRCKASVPTYEWRAELRGGVFSIVHTGMCRSTRPEPGEDNTCRYREKIPDVRKE